MSYVAGAPGSTSYGADHQNRARRKKGQAPDCFEDDFKAYPRVALHKSLSAQHIDVMMVLLGLTRIEGPRREVVMARNIDTELISYFTAIDRTNIGRYITELEEGKFLKTRRSGKRITEIAWGHRAGIYPGLRQREEWVYMPRAVLLDPTLPSTAVQTYALLRLLSRTLLSSAERARGLSRKPVFHPGAPLLMANAPIRTRVTARKRMQELRDLQLIVDEPDVPSLKGIGAISFAPLELRYAFLEDHHKYYVRGLSAYVPVDAVNGPVFTQAERYERYIDGGEVEAVVRKIEDLKSPPVDAVPRPASSEDGGAEPRDSKSDEYRLAERNPQWRGDDDETES